MNDEQKDSDKVAIEIVHVPEGRGLTVVLLGPWSMIWTHWQYVKGKKGRGVYCPGDGECSPKLHNGKRFAKFYAATLYAQKNGEAWVWIPAVLEVTETMWTQFPGRDLRGDKFNLARKRVGAAGWENTAQFVERLNTRFLPDSIDVRQAVSILYGHVAIEWASFPTSGPRQEMQVHDTPLLIQGSVPEQPREQVIPQAKTEGQAPSAEPKPPDRKSSTWRKVIEEHAQPNGKH